MQKIYRAYPAKVVTGSVHKQRRDNILTCIWRANGARTTGTHKDAHKKRFESIVSTASVALLLTESEFELL